MAVHYTNYVECYELISVLLVAEKQSDLLTKDHTDNPIGTKLVREEHANTHKKRNARSYRKGHGQYSGKEESRCTQSKSRGRYIKTCNNLVVTLMIRCHLPTRVALSVQIQFMKSLVMLMQRRFLSFALGCKLMYQINFFSQKIRQILEISKFLKLVELTYDIGFLTLPIFPSAGSISYMQ